MKHLPLKLGIGVVVVFGLLICGMFLWKPLKVRWYVSKLRSEDPKERATAVDGLLAIGEKGVDALAGELYGGRKAAELLAYYRSNANIINCLYKLRTKKGQSAVDGLYAMGDKGINLIRNRVEVRGYFFNDKDYLLHFAAANGYPDVIGLLVDKGIDINVKSYIETTPLHSAAFAGCTETARLLIAKGADVNAKSRHGLTPLDLAIRKKKVAELLRSHGGKTGEELKRSTEYQVPGTEKEEKE